MLKINVKKFCQQTLISFKNVSNLNQLIYYTMTNYENFTSKDFIMAFKVFENFKYNEEEYRIKFYELIDYAFFNEKHFADIEYLKSLLELYTIIKFNDDIYTDYIANQTIKRNIQIFQSPSNYLYFIKKFSQIRCKNTNLWDIFEEAYFDMISVFTVEETLTIINLMIENKKGSNKFLNYSFDLLNKKESEENSIYLDIMRNLINNFNDYYDNSHKGKIVNFINTKILLLLSKDIEIENVSILFPSLIKINDTYSELDRIKIENLKDKLLKQLNSGINKISPESLAGLINELNKLKYDMLDSNEVKKYFLKNENTNNFRTNLIFLNYLSMFPQLKYDPEIEKISNDDLFWEDSIEQFYHFSLDEEIGLFQLLLHYEVKYPRIWIILQTFLKDHLTIAKDYGKVVFVLNLINSVSEEDNHTFSTSMIFKPFIYSLENLKGKLIVERSHNINVNKL